MERGFQESSNSVPSSATSSAHNYNNGKRTFNESMQAESTSNNNDNNNNNNNESSDFECNICLELAQDPIVTLCGHLFCWPCLHKWLVSHSHSQECPVCKALVQQDILVPLYGRGSSTTDPRSRPVPGVDIPNRPPGQRPDRTFLSNLGSGFVPMASVKFRNITLSAGFAGYFLPSFTLQFNGSTHIISSMYSDIRGFLGTVHSHELHHHDNGHENPPNRQRAGNNGQGNCLKELAIMAGVFVLVVLLWS